MEFNRFRRVNKTLDHQPRIGPFPADQFVPWIVIGGISYYLGKQLLGLSWVWTGILATWGISTWWVLTARGYWLFFAKVLPVPYWVRGLTFYVPLLNQNHDQNRNKKS